MGSNSSREGTFEGFSLGSYRLSVDYAGRLFRDGRRPADSRELSGIFDRLRSMRGGLVGAVGEARPERNCWAASLPRARDPRLREVAGEFVGVRHAANLSGCQGAMRLRLARGLTATGRPVAPITRPRPKIDNAAHRSSAAGLRASISLRRDTSSRSKTQSQRTREPCRCGGITLFQTSCTRNRPSQGYLTEWDQGGVRR